METDVGAGQSISNYTVKAGDLLKLQGSPGLGGYPASAYNTIVNDGGQVQAYIAYLKDAHIDAGGQVTLSGNHSLAEYTYIAGSLTLTDAGVGANYSTVAAGGVLALQSLSSAGTTQLLDGGQIDLTTIPYGSTSTSTFDAAHDILTVTGQGMYGPTSTNLSLSGTYDPNGFVLKSDGRGGTSVYAHPLCFSAGTLIATPEGEVPVEQLRVGDRILVASGAVRDIRWIGSSNFLVFDSNRPVVVRRGALFGSGPNQDLRITSGHSLFFKDVLIPAGELVNGVSIAWDTARTFRAYHIELACHDIVIANGVLAETFRDDGNRDGFSAETGEGSKARAMPTCAPVVRSGPIVERTRDRLAKWANTHWNAPDAKSAQSPTVRGSEFVSSSIS